MRNAFRWVLVACLAVGLSACGDKGGGSGGGSSTSPVGAWTFDVDKVVQMAEAEAKKRLDELPPEQRKAAEAMMGGAMGKQMREMFSKASFDLTFRADNTVTMAISGMPGTESESGEGTWKLEGTKLTVTPKTKNGKPVEGKDAEAKDLVFKDGIISLQEGNGPPMQLKRK